MVYLTLRAQNDKRSIISKHLQFICETANTKETEVINGYKSHVYKREYILSHEQTIAMIIELNHVIPGFDNDEIKDILYYISTISILIWSILFYLNKCTATDQIDCVYVWIKIFLQLPHFLNGKFGQKDNPISTLLYVVKSQWQDSATRKLVTMLLGNMISTTPLSIVGNLLIQCSVFIQIHADPRGSCMVPSCKTTTC